ncbi:MAG: hypothetical protein LKJ93_07100, partial [Bacteroidales bacterium]|jgi:hypothetical protein|nr:hypothetical protein [Bacteroidales bacterium]
MDSPNDASAQADILKDSQVNGVQNGICFALCAQWLADWASNTLRSPNEVWHEMKDPVTMKQIERNHQSYRNNNLSLNDVIMLVSRNGNRIANNAAAGNRFATAVALSNLITNSAVSMHLLRITLTDRNNSTFGHAVACIAFNGNHFLYDPNIGAMNDRQQNGNPAGMTGFMFQFYAGANLTVSGNLLDVI